MNQIIERVYANVQADGAGNKFRMFLMDEAARQLEHTGRDVIRLTLGKSDLPLHADIRQAIISAVQDPEKSNLVFPTGLPELREAISTHYLKTQDVAVSYKNIMIDAGTSSVYPTLFRLLLESDHEALMPLPYYPLYRMSALLAGATPRFYKISLDTLQVDMKSLAANITDRTRVVVMNSPGNPLGNVISQKELSQIVDLMPREAYLIFDEIYENVLFEETETLAPYLLKQNYSDRSRIIITNSFSKGYRMYTKRVGWIVLPDDLAEVMRVVLDHTRLTVDPAVQFGAVKALDLPTEVDFLRLTHRKRWNYVRKTFSGLKGIWLFKSSGGFYCTLDCRQYLIEHNIKNCFSLAESILHDVGVATGPGEDYGLPGTLRLSFTASRFEEAVHRLADYFTEQK